NAGRRERPRNLAAPSQSKPGSTPPRPGGVAGSMPAASASCPSTRQVSYTDPTLISISMPLPKSAIPAHALVARGSKIHRTGCYTTVPIRKKSFVVEYLGEIISAGEADKRYQGREHTYLFGLKDGKRVIDGTNVAAFINHSCDPNCEAD